MDLFEEYLNKKETSKWVKRALTDKSYKHYYEELNGKPYLGKHNKDLGTYGDRVISLCFVELMLDKESKLSIEKAKVESDEYLVKTIAKHYNLLKFIDTDENNNDLPRNYDFIKPAKKNKDSPHKYIATAVEAMIGAIFKETNDLKPIIELLDSWRKF